MVSYFHVGEDWVDLPRAPGLESTLRILFSRFGLFITLGNGGGGAGRQ